MSTRRYPGLRLVAIWQLIPVLVAFRVAAAEIPMDSMGEQFYAKGLVVNWKLAPQALPATVRIFKVGPRNFSESLITNLMGLGGFAVSNQIRGSGDGEKIPRKVMVLRSDDDQKALTIDPNLGMVSLRVQDPKLFPPEGVPDKPRAYLLATNLLRLLAFPTGEMIMDGPGPKAWFYEGTTTSSAKGSPGKLITRRSQMGVEFRRQLDGFACNGEDIHIDFEGRERISLLQINWRGLQPSAPYPVASRETITGWIKEGRARVESFSGPVEARYLQTADLKKITITGCWLFYTGATRPLADGGEEEVGRLYPCAEFEVDAELAPDDHETIWLRCPIIAEGLNKPSCSPKNDEGFTVYPSKLREKQRAQREHP